MNISNKLNFPENITEFFTNTGIVDNAKEAFKKAENTISKLTTVGTNSNVVTNEIEFGKHTVRVNGVVIGSFWRKSAADNLEETLRLALKL